jgi:hypothetical protein
MFAMDIATIPRPLSFQGFYKPPPPEQTQAFAHASDDLDLALSWTLA